MTASRASAERSGSSSPLNVETRGEDRVLELVVLLRQLGGRSARPRRSCAACRATRAGRRRPLLLVPERPELVAAEEVGVPRDDRRLLRDFLLADADGPALLRPLEEIPLKLFLELRGLRTAVVDIANTLSGAQFAPRGRELRDSARQLVERERLRDDGVGVGAVELGDPTEPVSNTTGTPGDARGSPR